jgi:hypothetical protein
LNLHDTKDERRAQQTRANAAARDKRGTAELRVRQNAQS